jgi:hypothetical protein
MEIFKCAHTDKIRLSDLIESPLNANMHQPEQIVRLAEIIAFQGQRAPIIVSRRSGFIVKGHARLLALRKLGWEYAAVDYQDYTNEAEEYADLIADNEIAKWAEIDLDKHRFNLEEKNFDIEQKYFGIEKYDPIVEDALGEQVEGEEDFATELDEKTDYIVLIFDSKEKIERANIKFGLTSQRHNISGSGNEMFNRIGIGRVIDGSKFLD